MHLVLALVTGIAAVLLDPSDLAASPIATVGTDWADLIDEDAQVFADPYRDLSYDQLDQLVTVFRLTQQLQAEGGSAGSRKDLESQLSKARAVFEKLGIDPDWLIDQRWVVAEKRETAARSTNPAIDGTVVTMVGFVIGAPPDANDNFTAYLVPERGMCSHMPPPPPNQLIKLVFEEPWQPRWVHEPISVTGVIKAQPSARHILVVDGPVNMDASFTLAVSDLVTLSDVPPEPQAAHGGSWLDMLRNKGRSAQATQTSPSQ